MFDRLPTPFGLVRAGVAPDHPKIKSVIRVYEKTAARDGFRFFGNVEVGGDVSAAELAERYHAVIYAYGAPTDRHLGIPGEELAGIHAATAFVAWYNAHPDFADLEFDLSCERAVVIGNGNVATDVARMLALTRARARGDRHRRPRDRAARRLRRARDRRPRPPRPRAGGVHQPRAPRARRDGGRRRRRRSRPRWSSTSSAASTSSPTRRTSPPARTSRSSPSSPSAEPEGKRKRIVLRFLRSPVEIQGDGKVERVDRRPATSSTATTPARSGPGTRASGRRSSAGSSCARSATPGVGLEGVPFDERRGVIPNEGGRVTDPESGEQVPGQYAVGWIKRGPSGVIGTNKKDAQETVDNLIEDLEAGRVPDAGAGRRSDRRSSSCSPSARPIP